MVNQYKPREGSIITKEQAQQFGERISNLIQGTGKVTTTEVLNDAKKQSSPLHNWFEWDNTKAAEQYRKDQARYLLRNIVEVVIIEGVRTPARSFFGVQSTSKQEGYYVTVKDATTKTDYRKELLDKVIVHLENTTTLMRLFKQYEK